MHAHFSCKIATSKMEKKNNNWVVKSKKQGKKFEKKFLKQRSVVFIFVYEFYI